VVAFGVRMEEARSLSAKSTLRDNQEAGIAAVSASLLENVTRYHAQIGADVNRDALQQLEWNLLAEAKQLFHQHKYKEALNTFTHCLAVTEKTRSAKDHAVRGAVIHNIASCLHNLGEMEAAQAYYEQAIDAFKKAKTPLFERVLYGDANRRRVDFVKERLVDITWGRKPDGDKYLDENGVKRPVPASHCDVDVLGEGAHLDTSSIAPRLPSWASAGETCHDINHELSGCESPRARASYVVGGREAEELPCHVSYDEQTISREDVADDEQEAARKEWLQYHMQMGEWDEAAELVVSADEREDLEYLMQREQRAGNEP